jgi:hypothetical protein
LNVYTPKEYTKPQNVQDTLNEITETLKDIHEISDSMWGDSFVLNYSTQPTANWVQGLVTEALAKLKSAKYTIDHEVERVKKEWNEE